MPSVKKPTDYDAIDRLIDAGDLEHGRDLLAGIDAKDEAYAVLRIKISIQDGTLEPELAIPRLIQLMRRQKDWPGARELYNVIAEQAYTQRESSPSLSHVPPPVKPSN